MKFSFERNALINEISIAQELTGRNAESSVSSVSLTATNGELIIKAADNKMNIQAKIPVETEDEGTAVVFCSKLMNILTSLPDGEIDFEVQQKDGLRVALIKHSSKKIRYTIRCRDNFVEIPDSGAEDFFDVPVADFKKMILRTAYATSTEEKRYFLNGVFFEKEDEKLILVATDSRRLALDAEPLMGDVASFSPIIVHPKMLNIVAKHAPDEGSLSISANERSITFKFSNYILSASLIDGSFPNYRRVIPDNQPHKFIVDFSEFLDAVRRINVMVDEGKIFFDIKPGVLSISANGKQGEAREEIPCEYADEDITIAINSKYIEDALKVMDTERVAFEFSEALRGVTLRPEPAQGYFNILMPMQQ